MKSGAKKKQEKKTALHKIGEESLIGQQLFLSNIIKRKRLELEIIFTTTLVKCVT